jgi:type IV pilus assembly protein PilN
MPRINLLPWREGQRKERKLAFSVALGVAALVAGATTFIVYIAFGSMVEGQEARNEKLRVEIKKVDKQIEEINNLESSKQKFIARMTIIEQLQRSRPEIVHVFDEIVKTLPDGVYLTSVVQNSSKLKFEGVAQSSTRVSSFMRNIDSSDWLKNPELEVVQTGKNTGPGSSFTLTAEEIPSTPAADDGSGSGGGEAKGKKGGRNGKVMASNGGRQ